VQLDDAAVFSYLHAMGQLQSILHVRPRAVVDFMRQHSNPSSSSSGGEGLAQHASMGLVAAVFALKQLSSSPLLPTDLLAPLAKTSVELWMAQAAAAASHPQQQQQQEEEGSGLSGQHAVARASHGLTSLLLSSDPQLRLHVAAAWVQACTSSSCSDCSDSSAVSATFVPVVRLLLQQQEQLPLSFLLPAWQAVAQIASHLLLQPLATAATQQASPTAAHSSNTQAVAQVVQLLVQQLSAMQQPDGQVCLTPDAAERALLLQLLLAHILSQDLQQQDQQQAQQGVQQQQHDVKQKPEAELPSASYSEQPAPTSQQQQQLLAQLLSKPLLQQLTEFLLATLQALLPLLQQEQQGSVAEQRPGGAYSVSSPSDEAPTRQEGPGGYLNYQSLLSPSAAVSTWGLSSSCCGTFLGSSSSSISSRGEPQGSSWLLDPYLQGGRAGTRLLQALPVQLAAACVDTAHCLLQYGLVQAVNAPATAGPAALAAAGTEPSPASATSAKAAADGGGAAWRAMLCHAMDVPALRPVRRLSKQLLLEVCGSASLYKEARAAHLISRRTATLLETLNLNTLSSLQQQQQQEKEGGWQAPLQVGPSQQQQQQVMEQVCAVVSGLQGSWQQQSAVAAALGQLLSVAESQPVCWAQLCYLSSSSNSNVGMVQGEGLASAHAVLPLLLQLALQCQLPQLSLVAVKLFNAALSGVVKGSSKSKTTSSSSSSTAKPAGGASKSGSSSSKAATAGKSSSHGSSSSRHSDKSRSPSLGLDWLLAQQQRQQQQGMGEEGLSYGCTAPSLLSVFIDRCVVGWPEPQERKEAAKTLVLLHNALGVTSDTAAQSRLLQSVLAAVPAAGAASLPLFSAAGQLLKTSSTLKDTSSSSSSSSGSKRMQIDSAGSLGSSADSKGSRSGKGTAAAAATEGQQLWQCVSSTAGKLFATAAAAAAAMAAHPCGLAYQQLQELTELQHPSSSSSSSSGGVGYWLELSECDVAGGRLNRKPPSSPVRLDSIAAELKFGDKQVCFWRCCQCHSAGP
jgi:hypothetical protein